MTPSQQSAAAAKVCALAPVMPVLVIDDLSYAKPLAKALVSGGLPVLEVTLRTSFALDAIRAMAEIPDSVVGAGTLLTHADVKAAKAAGATFGVSPGATDRLIAACEDEGLPLLPGAATTSEIMALLERGYTVQKFFPAEQSGGVTFLKSIGSPIPQVKFCPTGGINLKNASDYLSLENTLCVGGSWVAPREAIISKNWTAINKLATEAKRLRYSIF